ncbi:MAG: response regulator transcription factor [Muricauda sp.]|nr:response regulator transcription factor [Allomuricauda sp.]
MDILIIEDEPTTAKDLEATIRSLDPALNVVAVVDSIAEGLEWFGRNAQPDLILSDIQLADGLSFELLNQIEVSCPVIFCTAYDEYAIRAFEANGIDYLLKPIDQNKLSESLQRYHLLSSHFLNTNPHLNELIKKVNDQFKTYRTSFLISFQDKMIPVGVNDIAYFFTDSGVTKLVTLGGKGYIVSFTLEQLEQMVDPKLFFRANRQFIISYRAIGSAEPYISRKTAINLLIETPTQILVSKKRSSVFLNWLRER